MKIKILSSIVKHTTLSNLVKNITPPILLKLLKKNLFKNHKAFTTYPSWEEAQKASIGYDDDSFIKKLRNSAKLVFEEKEIYERDTVIFTKIQYSWPLLASLIFASSKCKTLKLIDFGGALGTSFHQNKRFLSKLHKDFKWRIVEQPKLVDIGKKEFTDKFVSFYNTIEEASVDQVDVVFFGGSICYMKNPYSYLEAAIETKAPYVIIDRTPITRDIDDTFAIQYVHPSIYKAAYPIRNFNYTNFVKPFEKDYNLIEEWVCDLQADPENTAMGFIFERNSM